MAAGTTVVQPVVGRPEPRMRQALASDDRTRKREASVAASNHHPIKDQRGGTPSGRYEEQLVQPDRRRH